MATVESLTRRYAGFTAVDNVSFAARPDRVAAVALVARLQSSVASGPGPFFSAASALRTEVS